MSIHGDQIDILYYLPNDTDHWYIDEGSVNRRAEALSEGLQRRIKIKLCRDSVEFLREITANPNYQVVVMHLGGGDRSTRINAYDLAQKCRGITDASLVVESVVYGPTFGIFGHERNDADYIGSEARKYFDAYMGLMGVKDFGKLLREIGIGQSL